MGGPDERPTDPENSDESQDPVGMSLAAAWLTIGVSLSIFVTRIYEAAPHLFPSFMEVNGVIGIVLVSVLWIAGFRPSGPACLVYFVSQIGSLLLLAIAVHFLAPISVETGSWGRVGVSLVSIGFAGAIAFSPRSEALANRQWERVRRRIDLFLTPPSERNGLESGAE